MRETYRKLTASSLGANTGPESQLCHSLGQVRVPSDGGTSQSLISPQREKTTFLPLGDETGGGVSVV